LDSCSINNFAIDGFMPGIKSIQHGASIIQSSDYEITTNISIIDPNKSIIFFTWRSIDFFSVDYMPTAKITSNTQIKFQRGGNGGGSTYINWTVVEFNNVKSKQSGETLTGTNQADIDITVVNRSKSILIGTIRRLGSSTDVRDIMYTVSFVSDTQVRFIFVTSLQNTHVVWQVIEFD